MDLQRGRDRLGSFEDTRWSAVLELNGGWRDREEVSGVTDANSGGSWLFVSPGINVTGHNWSLYASLGVPLDETRSTATRTTWATGSCLARSSCAEASMTRYLQWQSAGGGRHRKVPAILAALISITAANLPVPAARAADVSGATVTAAFGTDGRLWRAVPRGAWLEVDYSTDDGAHFSPPVRVNAKRQRVRATPEDRPGDRHRRAGPRSSSPGPPMRASRGRATPPGPATGDAVLHRGAGQ